MRIGSSKDMDSKTLTALGKISAVSEWRGAGESVDDDAGRLKALHKLMLAAEDFAAAALIDVKYSEEVLAGTENHGAAPLKRVCATAVAVTLKSA